MQGEQEPVEAAKDCGGAGESGFANHCRDQGNAKQVTNTKTNTETKTKTNTNTNTKTNTNTNTKMNTKTHKGKRDKGVGDWVKLGTSYQQHWQHWHWHWH